MKERDGEILRANDLTIMRVTAVFSLPCRCRWDGGV